MESKPVKTKRQILTVIIYMVLALALVLVLIFVVATSVGKKMRCESADVSISISYTDNEITGYSSYSMGYDLEGQREYAQKVGIESYLTEFQEWFESSTDGGVCHR